MEKIIKYPIIMCNLSTATMARSHLSYNEENSLCILYKNLKGKAKFIKVNLEEYIELINFTKEDKAYLYVCNTSKKGFFGKTNDKYVYRIDIPENIMFK